MGCCNLGKLASLWVSGDNGLTYVKLGGVRSLSYDKSTDSVDATTADDDQVMLCPGQTTVTITADGLVCIGDAGMSIVEDATSPVSGNTPLMAKLYLNDYQVTGTKYWIGKLFIDSDSSNMDYDDNIGYSLSGNFSNITQLLV